MPQKNDTVKFLAKSGWTISGRIKDMEIVGTTENGLTILEIIIIRNKIYETFKVLEDNVEVIAYGNRSAG